MSYIPFICLGIGFCLGIFNKRKKQSFYSEKNFWILVIKFLRYRWQSLC